MTVQEHNPLRKFAQKPTRGAAIKAKCCECMGCTEDEISVGFRSDIRDCTATACPLHRFRPFQRRHTED